ncbi:iron-sulfur cluster carrier protein ApbC [Marinimicrobium alkaliphilum]|uniref:iron-sulfur cluster carrier protein ApbC n=1 Tax=Marinimicrobium alkaliphilum TaxID=2202654 RepID=UPI000DB9F233|nr:iron-sulfur cluster carrier protein ApbC [Marinimicrobium alkaliphilum]
MSLSVEQVRQALVDLPEPTLGVPLSELGVTPEVSVEGGKVSVRLVLGYAADGVAEALAGAVNETLAGIAGVADVAVEIAWEIAAGGAANQAGRVPGVKNIIAVASGKGGVGKSTTAVNLALALSAEGARVGILDADIYGPSIPQMLGIGHQRPQVVGEQGSQQMIPIEAHGIQSISMGYLASEKTPMVWRGPMASGALQQLLTQTRWDEVDYLVIDMPPGTGDIQLTLSQKVPVTGAVIVTTPQDIALLDAQKGIEMFRKVSVPVLGVVENMAVHICSNCGHEEHIFGAGGGERIARDYATRLLGSLPLDLSIRVTTDAGKPSVVAEPDGAIALRYRAIARELGASLWQQGHNAAAAPEIVISDD